MTWLRNSTSMCPRSLAAGFLIDVTRTRQSCPGWIPESLHRITLGARLPSMCVARNR